MADLIVKRAVARRDLLRRYAVEVDGSSVAYIRAGRTIHVRIAEGMREVRFSIDGYSSKSAIILASNQCVAILHSGPAKISIVQDRTRHKFLSPPRILPLDRTDYINAELERAADLARAFMQAAWSVARYQIQERTKPGDQSRYGLTAGDLSVLYHGCRTADANLMTSRGSANDLLWGELTKVGWLTDGTIPLMLPRGLVCYRLTELGRTELLEVLE